MGKQTANHKHGCSSHSVAPIAATHSLDEPQRPYSVNSLHSHRPVFFLGQEISSDKTLQACKTHCPALSFTGIGAGSPVQHRYGAQAFHWTALTLTKMEQKENRLQTGKVLQVVCSYHDQCDSINRSPPLMAFVTGSHNQKQQAK